MTRTAEVNVHPTTMRAQARTVSLLPSGRWHISERIRDDPRAAADMTYHEASKATVMDLHADSLIKVVGRVQPTDGAGSSVTVWLCPDRVRERAQEIVDSFESPVGCGHTGVRNLRNGGYTCTDDTCDIEVSRAEVDL